MTKLVTVHGTGGGADAETGGMWWQEGSSFFARLGGLLDLNNVEVVRFRWGLGANSERERRKAGERLYHELARLDEAGEDYYLLAHSHGGSVIYNALLYSMSKGKPLQRLQAWCTVGSPFIDISRKRFLFSRLDAPGLGVYIFGLYLVMAALGLVIAHFTGAPILQLLDERLEGEALQRIYLPLVSGACLFGLGMFVLLYWYEWVGNRWISDRTKVRTAEHYAASWIGLIHEHDEALAALRGARDFKPQIIPRNFLVHPFSLIPVVFAAVTLGWLALSVEASLFKPLDRLKDIVAALTNTDASQLGVSMRGNGLAAAWFGAALAALVILALTTTMVYVCKMIGGLIGRPLAAVIDRLVWGSVREQAWGDDLSAEDVRGVSSHPPFFALRFRTLPASVAEPIEELSDSSASSTLRKLRGSLGVLSSSNRSPDFLTTALQQLSWRELIHTSYFDVDAFVRLVALVFHRQGMSALRAEAWSPADRAAARVALRDMTISQVANAGDVERVGSGRAVSSDRDLKLSEQQKTLVAIAMFAGAVVAGIALTAVWLPLAWAVGIWLAGALAIIVLAQLVPVSLRGLDAVPAPTRTYEEAKRRFAALADQPEAIIHPRCVPYVLDHGKRVAKSYVLVHGISNCPYSMLDFAPRLHGLGHNVVIARMPFNGHLDNGTDALRHIKAEELREFADACIDIAAGLGERVHVVGISAGGVIAGWMAQNRSEIDRALLVAPAFGLSSLGTGLNAALLRLILFVPDLSIWKDPIRRARGESRPHSYKRMSTRGMGEVMRLGLGTLRQAKRRRAGALSVTVAMNAADTVVDPALPDRLAREWEIKSVPVTRYTFPREWKLPHEMIDGTQEGANISISHPKLAELAERPPDVPQRQPPRAPEPVDGRTKPPAGAKSDASTAEKMPQPMTQSA